MQDIAGLEKLKAHPSKTGYFRHVRPSSSKTISGYVEKELKIHIGLWEVASCTPRNPATRAAVTDYATPQWREIFGSI
jgi:hypothetical protein